MKRRTIRQASEFSGIPESLIRSVVRQAGGVDSLEPAYSYGCLGGVPGFTYYSDTVAFFRRHRSAISALVERVAYDIGEEPLAMVSGFRCMEGESHGVIGKALYGSRYSDEMKMVANCLAWFTCEEVARAIYDS